MDAAITGFALSPQQKHLWLLAQEGEAAFRSRCTVFLRGDLEPETLKAALADLAQRHEVLRTVFHRPPGLSLPLQVVGEPGWDLREDSFVDLPPEERAERLGRLRARLAAEPMDLARGPLWRAALVALAPREHALLLEVPALCADRRGLIALVREIARSWTALAAGGASAGEPAQYIDLSEWQNELLSAADTRPGREHWRRRGTTAPPPPELPLRAASRADGANAAPFQPRSVAVALPPAAWGELRALAGREQTDLRSLLLAAWALLLARLTGRAEQEVGLLADGRNFSELVEAVGLFARCLPLSFTVAPHRPFTSLLRDVAGEVGEAVQRQQFFSWEDWEGGSRTATGVPCPEVAFELAELPEPVAAPGVTLSLGHAESTSERFGLKLLCSAGDEATTAEIGFDAARFQEEDVRRLAEGLSALLAGVLASPEGAVGDFEILGPGERARRLVELNRPEPPLPAAPDLCGLFDRQAEARPEALAVVAGAQSLTWRELADQANRLAHHLRRLGVGPEVCVALCLDRSVEMIVSLLAVLKAGGAYVPLDPGLPQERLELMLADAGARVLVVHGPTSLLLPAVPAIRLDLGAAGAALAAESPVAPPPAADADNLAYVIYTSGSTGRPKGVAISRGQLASYTQAVAHRLDLPAGAGYALISTFAADLGNTVLFPALAGGGCLHVLTQEHASDTAALADYAGRHAIDCLKIVPSHLRALLDGPRPERVLPRRCLVLGGEATDWAFLARVQELAPGCRVLNHYGPTETTVGALTCAVPHGWRDPDAATLPLGRPLPNSRVYVVDARLQAVPGWVPGEVLIGGEGVARGYVGHPALTAERFVPDPFAASPGRRVYRSGDLARHLPSGLLEFLGRSDDQVKIRGFRVEPGEVAALLRGHPAVREAVVLAREDGGEGRRLVAYVVPARGGQIAPDELRSWLRQRLPEHMVPAALVVLKALPLTSNGKLDRRALPAPEPPPTSPAAGGAPPDPAEEILLGIWSDLLGTARRIGRRDSFFELGGHSLLAMQLISRVRDAFHVEIPLPVLFSTPTVAGLAERIAAAGRPGRAVAPPIERVPRGGDLPLSFAQQRLWFLDRLEPGSPFYNITRALRLHGHLDVRSLGRALGEIVRRHEALRTTFPSSGGFPAQVIAAAGDASLSLVDLGGLGTAGREAVALDLATLWARSPFDLARGPLLRLGLLRLGEQEHLLLAAVHHSVADGWSMGVLVREIGALYAAFVQGEPSPLPELPVQYADFAAWQRSWLQGEVLEEQIAFWRGRLAGAPRVLELPADRPRPPVQTFRGAVQPLVLPPALAQAARGLGRRESATLFMTLLAAWAVLLGRHAGQEDLLVGTPIAGRNRREIEDLVGFFVNTLVLRIELSAGDSGTAPAFLEVLGRVRAGALTAFAHQDLPFERLVEELAPERDLSRSPLFQVLFSLQNAPAGELRLPGLTLAPVETGAAVAKFDLSLYLVETGAEITGGLEHNRDLFDAGTVERLGARFAALLAAAVADPGCPVGDLPLLSPAEVEQLVTGWNDTAEPFPADLCVHERIAAQAARTPEAVALSFGGEPLFYQELVERAGRLARRLVRLGVGPDVPVGLCADRSPALLVGVLGILQAGGAYVPLDPTHPRERLGAILADSGLRVLVTENALLGTLPHHGVPLVLLDGETAGDGRVPLPRVHPENLAYVLFTSGSTGRSKGVAVSHRGVMNFLTTLAARAGFSAGDVVVALTTLSFDIAVTELLLPLTIGARIELVRRETAGDARLLAAALESAGATVLQATPATWTLLVDGGWQGRPGLKALCGGEALPRALADRLLLRAAELWNLYGPTETTVWSTLHRITADERRVPIGHPLGNTTVHLLGRWGELVPVGVVGELWIGGAGLARGYHGRPDLTAERFLPDPFAAPGARLYRTGDLARRLPDGALDYLGRADFQVKVRGHRIELGEIEAALRRHPDVRDAVAVVRQDAPDEKRLAAYVVPAQGKGIGAAALADFLRGILPASMIPAAFSFLPALPLTPSGKVDRRALPAPDRRAAAAGAVEPRDPLEELLAGVWAEVLRLDRVGVHDDFFLLGGHSLLATQVISRLHQALGMEVPLRWLFEAPTVAGLARKILAGRAEGAATPAPPLVPVPRGGDLPLSFAQQRLWLIDRLDPGSPAYNMPLALRLTGEVTPARLGCIFAAIVRRHEVLRTTFVVRAGAPVQVIAPAEDRTPPVPVVDLSYLPDAAGTAAALARDEARRPFDLRHGPLLRLGLLRLGTDDHVLLLTLHHVVTDGWSQGVLLREIAELHTAFTEGRPPALPELPVQYADFAVWQRSWLQGAVLAEQLGHWRRRLAGAPRQLELPTDRPRPPLKTRRGAKRPVALPPDLAAGIRELGRREGVTPFMVLLAAWALLLGRHAGQEDVVVGTPIAGRNRRELEDLIGFFVNTLALRIRLDGSGSPPAFRELLGRVRESALDAFAHQDVPFERLVEELAPERDLAPSPLFQVLFVLQNLPVAAPAVPGLSLVPLPIDNGTAKLDLTLSLSEGAAGFAGSLEHDLDLFDDATVERLPARFAVLLTGAVAAPGRALPDLPLLLPAELEQVVHTWNATTREYPRDSSLPELFARVAQELPDGPAVIGSGEVWSYRRLAAASDRLARRLRALGVGPETPVGLAIERSPALVLGTLAIVKAGGAYVPLDAGHPDERLAFLLADTGARIVLVHGATRDRMAALGACCVDLEDAPDESAAPPPPPHLPADSLAYVLYTSGSTGRPKGVAVPHRAVVRLVRQTDHLRLGPGDRVAHLSNTSFDAATYEIWGALLNGAAVAVIPRDTVLSSSAGLAAALAEQRVTSMFLTSALFTRMAAEVPDAFHHLHEVLVGGEAVSPAAARRVLAGRPPRRLLNAYGPTESTTFAAWYPIREVPADAVSVPIGFPLANTTLYVLDRRWSPVPPGSVGELAIGGDGLARGYLGRPELSAERFVPHPWGDGERLYRTGDLVRRRPDGALEILGRLDHQIKIRGFRIEPGEIETVLASHPAIRECVVVACEGPPGSHFLAAYVVGSAEPPEATGLRTFLSERLPGYMVPSAFVVLEALPFSPNGKVDRRALPDPQGHGSPEHAFVAPSDPVEVKLAAIWSEVLRRDRIGAEDDFFALGGHSLLATQVVTRVEEVLGVEIPLRDVFEAPTLRRLARRLREQHGGETATPPLLPATDPPRSAPLSFAQQRLWFLNQLEPGNPAYNVPLAVRLTGGLSVEALERTFAEVVRRHEALRTSFPVEAGQPVQRIAASGDLRLELQPVDLSDAPEEAREEWVHKLVQEEAGHPFDLENGALLRCGLLRLGEREHLLLVTFHHIVSDGWSMGVLLRELGALYPAFLRGEPSPLPELRSQYADFARWQRSRLQGEVLEQLLSHWKDALAGAPTLLELPTDRPRPAVQSYRGALAGLTLAPGLPAALRELCRKAGVTPFMLLLASWAVVLGRYAGQEDVLLGSTIAGRNRREIEDLIGFFVNTLVLRTNLAGSQSFAHLLGCVRETALDAFAHQDLPFELLVEELTVERNLAHSPLIQAMLTFQNTPAAELRLADLTFSPVERQATTAKFDLGLGFRQTAEGFAGSLEYATDLFDPSTAERLLGHLTQVLTHAAASPACPLSELRFLSAAEERLLQTDLNQARRSWALPGTVQDLFTRQARRTPDKTGAVGPRGAMTYREIAERSSALAQQIGWAGAGAPLDRRIGLLADPDPEVLVGMLGILKAGGGFVPMDTRHPDERLAWTLQDCGCEVLVTQRRHVARVAALAPGLRRVVCLEDALPSATETALRSEPLSLAYAVYTSGSAGRPKGVQIAHESLVPMLHWGCSHLGLGEHTRVLQSLAFCFDFGIFEILTTVVAGGTLLFPGEAAGDPEAFAQEIARHGVNTLHTTPAFARELARAAEAGRALESLEILHLGGEALPRETAARLREAAPRAALYNGYGPTEATINSSIYRIDGGDGEETAWPVVPIGRRSADNALYVLDPTGRLAPLGARGELCVGGIGVARGYLGRPGLTAERFVPDPFGTAPGGRLYRTGDLVRYLPEGGRPGRDLEFLGRIDQQVKLRGFRIELGEIESALQSHPAVSACVALLRTDAPGDPRLVAYVVLDPPDDPEDPRPALAAWLRGKLPEYMVPALVLLDALPLTTNGKVDRRALPAPERRAEESAYVAPGDPLEEKLAGIYQEVLQLNRVGIHDNFFSLGGHSLLATQVVTRVRETLGLQLHLRRIFEAPTVHQLARGLRGGHPA